jgi:hypothetical protein
MTLTPGDRVIWRYTPRGGYGWRYTPRGGYGYTQRVDAEVIKIGPKRVKSEFSALGRSTHLKRSG